MTGRTHDYPSVFGVSGKMTSLVLSAGVAAKVVNADMSRKLLTIQNVGLNPLSFGFATLAAGGGISLDPASAANGEGGSYEFKDVIPGSEIWAISAAGTTIVVMEGF